MRELNAQDKKILLDLLDAQEDNVGVEPLKFRVRNEEHLQNIDDLLSDGYIRIEANRYVLSLIALTALDSSTVTKLLSVADALFWQLKAQYRANLTELIPIAILAERAKVEANVARKAMLYMTEISCYSGYSQGFPFDDAAQVGVHERILRYSTFEDAVEELRMWSASARAAGGLDLTIAPKSTGLDPPQKTATGPAWHKDLKEPLGTILRETYESRATGHRALPAMGVRTVIDLVCTDLVGDKSTFKAKIAEVKRLGYLTSDDCDAIYAAFDAGSAAAHRGYIADDLNLSHLIEVMEHLLRAKYRLSVVAAEIKTNTPRRKMAP